LGRDGAHWSFLLNSSNSVMYGNDWRANDDGTFTSIGRPGTFFSPLDLYLMGLQPAAAVPPFLLIDSHDRRADELPETGVTVTGTPRTITIGDVIAAEGERVPSAENAPKRFKLGFVLLVRAGHDAEDFELTGINTIRDAFTTRMVILTDGKAIVD